MVFLQALVKLSMLSNILYFLTKEMLPSANERYYKEIAALPSFVTLPFRKYSFVVEPIMYSDLTLITLYSNVARFSDRPVSILNSHGPALPL
jgi:hypothetical protein